MATKVIEIDRMDFGEALNPFRDEITTLARQRYCLEAQKKALDIVIGENKAAASDRLELLKLPSAKIYNCGTFTVSGRTSESFNRERLKDSMMKHGLDPAKINDILGEAGKRSSSVSLSFKASGDDFGDLVEGYIKHYHDLIGGIK